MRLYKLTSLYLWVMFQGSETMLEHAPLNIFERKTSPIKASVCYIFSYLVRMTSTGLVQTCPLELNETFVPRLEWHFTEKFLGGAKVTCPPFPYKIRRPQNLNLESNIQHRHCISETIFSRIIFKLLFIALLLFKTTGQKLINPYLNSSQ